jgi:cysteine desulfurase
VSRRVYLDDAGGAPVLEAARAARAAAPEANPISPHGEGRSARAFLDRARDEAARALGGAAQDIVFCASGTEAVNLALLGAGRRLPAGRSVVTWTAEHQSVIGAVRRLQLEGHRVELLPVDGACLPDPRSVPDDAGLISIALANNEVGTVQPIAEIAARAREVGALLHIDCGQGPRWMVPPIELADLASFSGQKLGAGGGGLLYARLDVLLEPLLYGGPQEWGRRGGHVDVGQAAAVAAALRVCAEQRDARASAAAPLAAELRGALEEAGAKLVGAAGALPNYACGVFAGRRGEDMLMALDLAGVAASSGSACAAGSLDPSHVLLAMGRTLDEAGGGLRLTVGYETTPDDARWAAGLVRATFRGAAG